MKVVNWLSEKARHIGIEAALEKLREETGIIASHYKDANLIVLNYDQIESPKRHEFVIECRGLILGYDTFGIFPVSRSFDRFFNLGECEEHASITSLKDHHVFEKVDGSLIKVYNWLGEWRISTRGTAFAESQVNGFDISFRELFLRAIGNSPAKFEENLRNLNYWVSNELGMSQYGLTYIFELATPENRVVTRYEQDQVVLLGARYTTGEEADQFALDQMVRYMTVLGMNVRLPKVWKLAHIDDVREAVKELKGLEEGFVVHNRHDCSRFKIKSAAYLLAHHIRGNGVVTPKRAVELVVTGEHVEYLNYFPDDARFFEKADAMYTKMLQDIPAVEATLSGVESQKDFAIEAVKYPFSDALFRGRKTKTPALQAFLAKDTLYKMKVLMSALGEKE